MKRNYIIILLAIILLYSCVPPDIFMLNKRSEDRIDGFIVSKLDSVELVKDNAIMIHDGGIASLKLTGITQLKFDVTMLVEKGDGVKFSFRTVKHNYPNNPSISFVFSPSGSKVRDNNIIVADVDSVKLEYEKLHRIIIKNDGNLVRVKVDCDEIYVGKTELLATEYLIVESLSGTSAFLSGINFADILVE